MAVVALVAMLAGGLVVLPPLASQDAHGWVPVGQAIPDRVSYGPNQPIRLDGVVGFFPDCKKRPHRFGIGIDDVFQPWADIYAVPAGSASVGGSLSGPPLVVFGGIAGGYVQELLGYAGPGGRFAPGVYDIVIDECQDRFVDPEDAIISDAFRVVIPLDAEPATIPPIDKDRARRLGGDYRALSLAWDAALKAIGKGKVAGNAGFLVPTDVSIAIAQGAAFAAGQSPLPDPRPAISTALLNKSRAQARIAADPPDPLFRSHAPLVASRVGPPTSNQVLEVAIHDAARNTAVDAALVDALVTAVERHQGAAQVGAGDWMAAHARDALALLDMLQERLPQAAADHRAVAAAFRSSADPQWSQWMLHQEIFALLGASQSGGAYTANAVNRRVSMNRGIDEDDIRAQLERLAPANELRSRIGTGNTNNFPLFFDAIADDVEAQAAGFADLRADLERALADLAAEGRDRPLPTADAGGPYTASTGVPITLDGTRSSGPVDIDVYEWDTTLDGSYDTTGATPSVTFDEPGRFLVALEVTDVDGGSSLGVAEVEVTASDLPPTVEAVSVTPAKMHSATAVAKALVELEPGDPRDFELSITVSDPEGDDLTVTWYRNGTVVDEQTVASGTTVVHDGTAPSEEAVTLLFDAVVTDSAGNVAAQPFMVTSFGSDNDNDGWRTPLDCDDDDQFVNPGSASFDRDCNPDTSSSAIVPQAPVITTFSTPQFDGPLATFGVHQNDELFFSVAWSHPNRYTGETFDVTFDWGDGTTSSMQVAGTTGVETAITTSRSIDIVGRIRPRVCITAPEGSTSAGLTGCRVYGNVNFVTEAHQLAPEPVVNPADVSAWTIDKPRPEFIPPVDARWYIQPYGAAIRQENNPNYPHWVVSDFELDAPGRITMGVGSFNADDDWYGFALGVQPGELREDDADWIAIEFGHQLPPGQRTGRPECDAVVDNPREAVTVSRVRGVPTIEEFLGVTTLDLADDPNPRCNDDAGVELLGTYMFPPGLGTSQGLPQYLGWPARAARPNYRAGMYHLDVTYTPERLLLSIDGVEIAAIDAPADDPFPQGRIAAQNMSQLLVRYTASNPAPVFTGVEGSEQTFTTTFADASINSSHEVRFDFGDGSPTGEGSITQLETGLWETSAAHTYADDGDYEITVCVRDIDNDVTGCGPLLVEVANADPVVDAGPDQRVTGPVEIVASYSDPGVLDTHTATIDWGDGSTAVAAAVEGSKGAGLASGSHSYASAGTYTVTVCVTDDDGGVGCDTLDVEVAPTRSVPAPLVTDGVTGVEGAPFEVGVGFTDDDTDTIHTIIVDWGDGPEPVTFQDGGAFGAGLAAHVFPDDGVYDVRFEICDIGHDGAQTPLCAQIATTVEIDNAAPVVDADVTVDGADATVEAGFTDPGAVDTHTATVDWGDGSDPEPVPVDGGPGSGTLDAIHTYSATGQYTIDVCVTDDDGSTGCDGATVLVTVLGSPPVLVLDQPADGHSADEGDEVTFAGSFSDPDVDDTHTVTVDPGDGSPAVDAVVDQDTRTFSTAHVYRDDPGDGGSFTATVSVCDDTGRCDETTVDVTVDNIAPEVDAGRNRTSGHDAVLDDTTFVDPGVDDIHTATVDWGDGTGPIAATVTFSVGTGTVQSSHTYADVGDYVVTVCVTDDDGGEGCDTFELAVVDTDLAVTVDPVDPVDEGGTANVGFAFTDPLPDSVAGPDRYTVTVRWSDGSDPDSPTVTLDSDDGGEAAGSGTATHVYADDGSYTVTVEVCDGARCGLASILVEVANVAPETTVADATTSQNQTTVTATFTDPGILDSHNATVDWGDGSSPTTASVTFTEGSGTAHATRVYSTVGSYTVEVCVTDDDGGVGCDTTDVEITELPNTPPTITSAVVPDPSEGTVFALAGSFVDPDSHDSWTLTVDWGDTTTTESVLHETGGFTTEHVYRNNGRYVITVVVDDGAAQDTLVVTVDVANLPPTLDVEPEVDGLAASLVITLTDPGPDDQLSATVDWGDGTVTSVQSGDGPAARSLPPSGTTATLSADHTYAADGLYLATICGRDDDDGEVCTTVPLAVLAPDDPDAPHDPSDDPSDLDAPDSDEVTAVDSDAVVDTDAGAGQSGSDEDEDGVAGTGLIGRTTSPKSLADTGVPVTILVAVGLGLLVGGAGLRRHAKDD